MQSMLISSLSWLQVSISNPTFHIFHLRATGAGRFTRLAIALQLCRHAGFSVRGLSGGAVVVQVNSWVGQV
jgi:hypothetical protein